MCGIGGIFLKKQSKPTPASRLPIQKLKPVEINSSLAGSGEFFSHSDLNPLLRKEDCIRDKLLAVKQTLQHRGPDDHGCYYDATHGIGLVHTRLAILDLSPLGRQPMTSANGRFTIVFNGEIYNYQELRIILLERGTQLRGNSDTEVLLELFALEGFSILPRLAGMFAFAIWDSQERCLSLARDPLGIKPLYVKRSEESIAFASELRALLAASPTNRQLSNVALKGYFKTGSVPEPLTMVDGVEMLPAGTCLQLTGEKEVRHQYWNIRFPTKSGSANTHWNSSVTVVRSALQESVRRHFVSDVPVGIFLSGGIDSTALVALARQAGIKDIKTFSISFDEAEFNEANIAAKTAAHFQTEHHVWKMTSQDGRELFASYLNSMDQPSNDGFNTFCVAKFAHDHGMKVVLSGLGGDELFGSYPSFQRIPKFLKLHRWLGPTRSAAAKLIRLRHKTGPKARIADFLESPGSVRDAYQAMRGSFCKSEINSLTELFTQDVSGNTTGKTGNPRTEREPDPSWEIGDQISFLELTRYMRNQLLRDSDVMSMAWGLELRVPFVDSRLIDVLSTIPSEHRLANGKKLLVDAVVDIPEWVINQPKRGFRFPFDHWIAEDPEWNKQFQSAMEGLAFKPKSWYQQWMIFCMKEFVERKSLT